MSLTHSCQVGSTQPLQRRLAAGLRLQLRRFSCLQLQLQSISYMELQLRWHWAAGLRRRRRAIGLQL